ncbi:MAG: stage 0 sporulation family protein [Phycisphaerales bacterium JB039]
MPIHPLPQFEADLAELEAEDRKVYDALKIPTTIVVRFGAMKMIGEFPWTGDAKPGCGSKIVIRSFRGLEVGEMLTSTCPNSGCSKSVTRKEMLDYIENSGGRQYPFHTGGRALRIATPEDMRAQEQLEQSRHGLKMEARRICEELRLDIKLVDAEGILGGETITYYYLSEQKADLGELRARLEKLAQTRVDLKQVGARDEARLTADYERCGQYCCCKNFLKVLKPVSMKSAKVQKATLDPLKISGRCGRLMCCLRYEDETYADLKARLPRRRTQVGTPEGDGIVIDTQILTQLTLVRLDADGRDVAVPVEELTEPGLTPPPAPKPEGAERAEGRRRRRDRTDRPERPAEAPGAADQQAEPGEQPRKRRRRRRRRSGGPDAAQGPQSGGGGGAGDAGAPDRPRDERGGAPEQPSEGAAGPRKKRRRRRRRRGSGGSGEGGGGEGGGAGSGPTPPGGQD